MNSENLIPKSRHVCSTSLDPPLMLVCVGIHSDANPGQVRLDLTNPDGSTTRRQNQIPLLSLFPGNSIVAPLAVRDAAIISPMPGVAVTPEQKLFAEGLLTVSGTGMITGFFAFAGAVSNVESGWLWLGPYM